MCPALHILDLRQAQDSQNNGGDPANSKFTSLLEDIRGQWCGMLGDDVQKNPNSAKILSDLLSLILGTYSQNTEEEDKPLSRNRDHIDQQMDLAMANNYRKAMKKGSEKCNGEGSKF